MILRPTRGLPLLLALVAMEACSSGRSPTTDSGPSYSDAIIGSDTSGKVVDVAAEDARELDVVLLDPTLQNPLDSSASDVPNLRASTLDGASISGIDNSFPGTGEATDTTTSVSTESNLDAGVSPGTGTDPNTNTGTATGTGTALRKADAGSPVSTGGAGYAYTFTVTDTATGQTSTRTVNMTLPDTATKTQSLVDPATSTRIDTTTRTTTVTFPTNLATDGGVDHMPRPDLECSFGGSLAPTCDPCQNTCLPPSEIIRSYELVRPVGATEKTTETYCDGHTVEGEIAPTAPYDPCTRPETSTGLPPDQATTVRKFTGTLTPAQQETVTEFCDGHTTTVVNKTASQTQCLVVASNEGGRPHGGDLLKDLINGGRRPTLVGASAKKAQA
jgi:hypothetical protein